MPRRIPVLEQRHEAGLWAVARPLVFTSRIVVESPKDGAIVTGDAFEMSGTYVGEVPTGHEIWLLSQDQYNYFLVYPPPEVYPAAGKWRQSNVRLATPGPWSLHVCIANDQAAQWLRNKALIEDWAGFLVFPEGLETARVVMVQER